MPKAIHDRAMRLLPEMKESYSPKKAKQVAFAVATQQAHARGEAPKKWRGKPFGTPKGKQEAKMKFDRPKSEYKPLKEAALEMFETALGKQAQAPIRLGSALPHPVPSTSRLPKLRPSPFPRSGKNAALMLTTGLSKIASDESSPLAPGARAALEKVAINWASLLPRALSGLAARGGAGLARAGRGGAALARATASSLRRPIPLRIGGRVPRSLPPDFMPGEFPIFGRGNIPALRGNPQLALERLRSLGGPSVGRMPAPPAPIHPWPGHGTSKVASAREMLSIVLQKQAQFQSEEEGKYEEPELTPGQKRRRRFARLTGALGLGVTGGLLGTAAGLRLGDGDWRGALAGGLAGAAAGGAAGYGLGSAGDWQQRMHEQAIAERIAREHALTRAVAAYT